MSERVQKTPDGKIQYYVMEGKLIFPSINVPNFKFKKEGLWETYLIPNDPEELEVAKKIGIKTKKWDDIPEAIYLKRYTTLKNGQGNRPVNVKDADGNPFLFQDESGREVVVGNNTDAKVMYHYWNTTNSYGTFHTYILDGVRIQNLVEKQDGTASIEEALDF
jgi:RNA polymerase subunit RPABC4/transcription elongation factor Spt4